MSAKKSRIAQNVTGQRRMPQVQLNAPPRFAFFAIASPSRLTSSKRWNRPSAPTRKAIAGKNARSELYAICWARPMQSSPMNPEKLRLNAASHSPRLSRSGDRGERPTRARRCSVAADKAEAAHLGLRLAFATAAEDQARGCADAACEQEADAERAGRGDRQVRAQLRADVRRLADAFAQLLGCTGELLSLGLDVAADVRDRARVATGHRSSTPRSSASPRGWRVPERAACRA